MSATVQRVAAYQRLSDLASIALGGSYAIVTALVGFGAFLLSWLYAIDHYGFFLGGAFGWFPAIILAVLAGLLWPLAAIGLLLLYLNSGPSFPFRAEFDATRASVQGRWFDANPATPLAEKFQSHTLIYCDKVIETCRETDARDNGVRLRYAIAVWSPERIVAHATGPHASLTLSISLRDSTVEKWAILDSSYLNLPRYAHYMLR